MSLSVVAGQPFTADADFGPGFTGLATVGVQILDSLGAVVQARATSGVAESPAGTGDYVKTFSAAPSAPGSYRLEWDTGGGSPQYAFEDLIVTGASITSVANAQAWLRRNHVTGTMATDDAALLTIAIKGVSAAIARYTSREFVDPSGNNTDVSRTFDYDGGGYLDFAPYDLRSITSITLGGSALTASTGVGDGDYQLKPRAGTVDGTYTYIDMRGFYKLGARYTIFSPMLVHRDVVIVGKWGMTAVPADVELACLIAVADMYRNPEQVSSRGSGDFTMAELAVNPGSEESLPPGARRLLDPFVRPKVV